MSQTITITNEDILEQVKLSGRITEIIDEILQRKMILESAQEAGIELRDEALQKTADAMRLMNGLESVEDTWAWLEKNYISIDDFEQIAYNGLISANLAKHLFADKVEPYFYENQLDYAGVVMYEVIFDDEDLAMELFYTIKEGEMSFYDVAHKYIQDKELSRKCGYQGILNRKNLKAEISAAVFAAKPPQLLKPIVTSKGIHLILVEEIIKPELNESLHNKILTDLFNNWLKKQAEELKTRPVIK
ncbi:MAG: peptidylprolyl isomerase [Cyanobacteria bacterium J06635_10]